jgi:hypothetical protein
MFLPFWACIIIYVRFGNVITYNNLTNEKENKMGNLHTTKYFQAALGQSVLVRMENLEIPCTVLDVKSSWGKVRLQVTPLNGNGSQWIELERVVKKQDQECYESAKVAEMYRLK